MARLYQDEGDSDDLVEIASLNKTVNERRHLLSLCFPEFIATFLTEFSAKIKRTRDKIIETLFLMHVGNFREELDKGDCELLADHLGFPLKKEGNEDNNREDNDVKMVELDVNLNECIVRRVTEMSEENQVTPARFIEESVMWVCEEIMRKMQRGDYDFLMYFYDFRKMKTILDRLFDELERIHEKDEL